MLRFRWILMISLVCGLLTTIATAWGLSWFEFKFDLTRSVGRTEETRPHRCLRIWRGVASTCTESWISKQDYNQLPVVSAPYWSAAAERPILPADDDPHVEVHEYAFGFPFRALMMHQDVVWVPTGLTGPQQPSLRASAGDMQHAITLTGWGMRTAAGRTDRQLPYAPVWRGILANTLVYGALFFVPLFALSLRRRVARSRARVCTRCGYDLRLTSEARCPECNTGIVPDRRKSWDRWLLRLAAAMLMVEAGMLTTILVMIVCAFYPGWSDEIRRGWMEESPARLLLERRDGAGGMYLRWRSDRNGSQYHSYRKEFESQGAMSDREKEFLWGIELRARNSQRNTARVDPDLCPWWAVQPPFPDDDRDPVNPVETTAFGWPWLAFRSEQVARSEFFEGGLRGGLLIRRNNPRSGQGPSTVIPAIPIWRGLIANTIVFAFMWIALALFVRASWRGAKALRRRALTRRGTPARSPRTSR